MNLNKLHTLGIDIGSTTVKIAILDSENEVLFSDYERHFANIQETLSDLLGRALYKLGSIQVSPVITGSGGLTLAKHLGVPFVQEVIAVSTALQDYAPQTDVAIELGGEDAKIIYFEGGNVEQRMNGVCAGGTGSFIDQMASLLQTDASGLNEYAKNYKALYSIVQRRSCRFYFSGCRKPDNQRTCMWKTNSRTCCISRRTSSLFIRTTRNLYPYFKIR